MLPKKKRRVGLRVPSFQKSAIRFNADEETAKKLEGFGHLSQNGLGAYELWVDARYDYDEVLDYINSLNVEGEL